jgi:flagellar hook protein FlgE
MLDSIYIGMSGLTGYSRGLRVIANNTANINTPGFKGSSLQFGDLFHNGGQTGGSTSGSGTDSVGQGLATHGTSLDFSQGELRPTGNDLDLAVDGEGLFTLKDESGALRYSRDGEFVFNDDGILISRITGDKVMGREDSGKMVEISLQGLRASAAKATQSVSFRGNLSSAQPQHSVSDVTVIDDVGGKHALTVAFKKGAPTTATEWDVVLKEGDKTVGSGKLQFADGRIKDGAQKLRFAYKPEGAGETPLVLDFGADVTSFATDTFSSIAMSKQDGYAPGSLTKVSFDEGGVLKLTYSNGQNEKGVRLALSRFESVSAVAPSGDNQFEAVDERMWESGVANSGAFGTVRSGVVEISNVDLSAEFSDLVIMQRGYQASSQVVSTANDMIQELFSLKK